MDQKLTSFVDVDVLCIGHASYDLVFSLPHHPATDEKMVAGEFFSCGGGPAANAAVQVARLGFKSAFSGYLGQDIFGDNHVREMQAEGIDTRWLVQGEAPTPLSVVMVKPGGQRALVNYKGGIKGLPSGAVNFAGANPKAVLFDGHEPNLALDFIGLTNRSVPSVLDGGSLHDGTATLLNQVDYLVCSEKFALQYAENEESALSRLASIAPAAVVTLGARGLIWRRGGDYGRLSAPPVVAVDSTGAGDAFHGAFAAGLVAGLPWLDLLRYASAAGAFCCTRMGARLGLADTLKHKEIMSQWLVD